MEIQYYLNELNGNEAYITPCPNGKKLLVGSDKPITVGSLACRSCEYFGSEGMKTVHCRMQNERNSNWDLWELLLK